MSDDELEAVWKSLTSRRPPSAIDAKPGIYALFLRAGAQLPGLVAGADGLLYIGKSDRSLKGRSHFTCSTGVSSPRRSLGALLRRKLRLHAVPRGGGTSRRAITHYCFTTPSEHRLSQWMSEHLDYAFVLVERPTKPTERMLIAMKMPPLNLTDWTNPLAAHIGLQRRLCQLEAAKA